MRFQASFLQQAAIVLASSAMAALGWFSMWRETRTMAMPMMGGAWMPPAAFESWTVHDFAMTFSMWAVMMVAMMMPAILPTLLRVAQGRRRPYAGALAFLSGYFSVWLLFCVVATLVQWRLQVQALLSPMMESRSVYLVAALFALAGIYQWTPWKAGSLGYCRRSETAPGCHRHAFSGGLRHGFYCVGSCWALMSLSFAVGVMNLLWMALITLWVAAEKLVPFDPARLRRLTGLALLLWGGYLCLPPDFGAEHFAVVAQSVASMPCQPYPESPSAVSGSPSACADASPSSPTP